MGTMGYYIGDRGEVCRTREEYQGFFDTDHRREPSPSCGERETERATARAGNDKGDTT